MNVKATMMKLCYTHEKLISKPKHKGENKKALQPDEIVEYNNAIGIGKADEVIEIETHFRGKYIEGDDKYAFITYVLGFVLEDCNPKDYRVVHSVFDVTELNVSVNFESNSYTLIQMEKGRSIFVKLPMFKWRKASYEVCNNIEDAVPGAIVPGSFFVHIILNSNNEIHKSYRINAKSSISMDDYKELLEDLRRINRELLLNKDAQQFVNFEKRVEQIKNTYKEVYKILSEIEVPLRNIIKNPKHSIKEMPAKIPVRSIKKYDAKTLIDLKMNSGIERIRALRHIEDYDIYEHKMIKYALMKLKKFIESLKADPRYECDSKRAAIKISLDKFKDFLKVENYSEVEAKFNEECAKLASLCNRLSTTKITKELLQDVMGFLNNYKNSNVDSNKGKEIKIKDNLWYSNWNFNPKVNIEGLVLKISYNIPYVCFEYDGKPIRTYVGRKDMITLASNDLELQEKFYKWLKTRNSAVQLCADKIIIRDDKCEEIVLSDNVKCLLANNIQNNNVDFYGEVIKSGSDVVINYLSNLKKNMEEAKEEFKKLYGEYIGFENISVDDSEIVNKFEKIEKILEDKIFKADINTHLKWHPTQIFLNDKNYYAIYKKLSKLDRSYKYTDVNISDEKILVNKLDKLYEYWVWSKMLLILVNRLRWRFSGKTIEQSKEFLIEKINNFLIVQSDSDEPIEIEHVDLELKKGDSISRKEELLLKLKIIFDEEIVINNKFKRPDYRFIFVEPNNEDKIRNFYLDAKLRDYSKQNGLKFFVENDIDNVAIQKYIMFFDESKEYEANEYEATASFIIHSDKDGENNRYRYFNSHKDTKIFEFLNAGEDNHKENIINHSQHRFGGFCMVPSNYDDFITFMKMIMEYHFYEYAFFKRICCECGSTNLNINERNTRGGYKKYHITCNECEAFWVKTHCSKEGHELFKHYINNFQVPEEQNIWYVKCPDCEFPVDKVTT